VCVVFIVYKMLVIINFKISYHSIFLPKHMDFVVYRVRVMGLRLTESSGDFSISFSSPLTYECGEYQHSITVWSSH
jgi:hypothetical protein